MEMKHRAYIAALESFFVVSLCEEREERTLNAETGLHNIGNIACILVGVKVCEVFAGGILMLGEVIIRAVGNAPELAPTEREHEFKVGCRLGIETKLLGVMVAQAEIFLFHAEAEKPVLAERTPV